jgi:hypothetical protein
VSREEARPWELAKGPDPSSGQSTIRAGRHRDNAVPGLRRRVRM